MDILIIPFEDDFEKPLDSIEYSSLSSLEARRIISKEILPSKAYHISILKDNNIECNVIIDGERSSVFRSIINLGTGDEIKTDEQEALAIALQFIKKNGVDLLAQIIDQKKEEKRIQDQKNLEAWKIRYKEEQKKDKKSFYLRGLLVVGVIAIIWTITSLIWTGEMQFVGRATQEKMGIIKEAEFYRESGKFVFQYVVYEFEFEGKTYEGRFKANKFTGRFYVGDSILIKFRESDPNYSIRVDQE